MKRIGIMTWYHYENYGTVLQASALYRVITKLGYQPELIQYTPKGNLVENTPVNISYIVKKAINKFHNLKNCLFFSSEKSKLFQKYLSEMITETVPCNTFSELSDLNSTYDAFVCGSDQIWSPLCFDEKYFLSFVSNKTKMIAYAPSIGTTKIENRTIKNQMKMLISRFNFLSVREKQAAQLIGSLCNKQATIVLDPTLLLNKTEWEEYLQLSEIENQKMIPGDYVICYFLGDYRSSSRRVMKYLSKILKMPAYVIPVFQWQSVSKSTVPFDVGPREFVSLIYNAKYVCTDSFHAMAFALNFGVPLVPFKRFRDNDPKSQNSRVMSLLSNFGLEGRLIDPRKKFDATTPFECISDKTSLVLSEMRKKSIAYLQSALSSATCQKVSKSKEIPQLARFCCGCGACAAVCPKNAIQIIKDPDGFERYFIDCKKCINCGICENVCPFINISALSLKKAQSLYSLKSVHSEVLKHSSSGGAAFEIAQFCNQAGYNVCGSVYSAAEDQAKHILIAPNHPTQLLLLQGSKYLQSVSADALLKIAKTPQAMNLLFFGTPCQVAGVDKILRNQHRRESAILVDLICHGVPSYWLWKRYLKQIENEFQLGEHPTVLFRDKSVGWQNLQISLHSTVNQKLYQMLQDKDDFYAMFLRGFCNMDACFECPYREKSAADIRIGDYWGCRFENDHTGVSMVIGNTNQGEKLLQNLQRRNDIILEQHAIEEYWKIQLPYNMPQPLFRREILDQLIKGKVPLSKIRKNYCSSYDFNEKLVRQKARLEKMLRHQ